MDVTAEVEVTKVKQLKNTVNGGTRWEVRWGRPGSLNEWIGKGVTAPDSQFVGGIVWGRVEGKRWKITLNGRNQITGMVEA